MVKQSKSLFFLKTLRRLAAHRPGKLLLIFGLTLFQGVSSGFSVVLLIPLLQLLNVGAGEQAEGMALFFHNLTEKLEITLSIETVLFAFIFVLVLNALIQYWKSLLDAGYRQSFIYTLRRKLFRKIILADWPLLNSKSKTNHLQVLTKEVPNLSVYYYYYLRLITTLLLAFSYLVYAILISPGFTLLIIVVGIVLFAVLRRFLFKAFHLGEEAVNSYSRLLKFIDDFWQTVKIAKVHSSEEFYNNKFDEANSSLLDLEYRMQKNYSLPQLMYRIAGIAVLVIVVYAGYRVENIPLASFFILIILFSRIFPQFVDMNTDLNMIISNVASVKLVMMLDEELPENEFQESIVHDSLPLEKGISLKNISFAYPDGEKIFENYSETIPAKQITGITGDSGRGKTTLIDLIAGLQKPDIGVVSIDGTSISNNILPLWKTGIGYLPQDSFFVDGTIRENLVWDSFNITDDEVLKVLGQVNASHLVTRQREGLNEYIVNYSFTFLGGERQRLALARVLLRKPRLLLLDEATSSLDADNEEMIMDVITRLKEHVTVVFVTHRESVARWCDKVIKL